MGHRAARAGSPPALLFLIAAVLCGLPGCSGQEESHPGRIGGEGGAAPSFQRTWLTMGTTAGLSLWGGDGGEEAFLAVRSRFARVDSLMSTYRETSDISRVNRMAGEPALVTVDTAVVHVIRASLRIAGLSGGRLDLIVGPLVDLWGFYDPWRGEEGSLPPAAEVDSARGILSVTVWAGSGLEADAWSTALFLAGPEEGRRLISSREGLGAVWVEDPGEEPLAGSHFLVGGTLRTRVVPLPEAP
ncbi:MAG: FAD:protein FMN transferase [bacterium]